MTTLAEGLSQIQKARSRLIIERPWWGSLSLKLRLESVPAEFFYERGMDSATAGTDGVSIFYYAPWFDSLQKPHQKFVLAHEVMHDALLHFARRGLREPRLWNEAADHVINLALKPHFTLLSGVHADERFAGMTAEQVYTILEKEKRNNPTRPRPFENIGAVFDTPEDAPGSSPSPFATPGPSEPGGGGTGKPSKKPEPQDGAPAGATGTGKESTFRPEHRSKAEIERSWRIAVAQAGITGRKAGAQPSGIDELIEKGKDEGPDIRDALARYVTSISDYSWVRPNRRYIHRGLLLPGGIRSRLSTLVIVVDTSGSMSAKFLGRIFGYISDLIALDVCPEVSLLIECDAKVQRVTEIFWPLGAVTAKGRGGTLFRPVFDYIEKNSIAPDAMVFLSDMESYDKPPDPGYPVLWIAHKGCAIQPPFGELVTFDEEENL